MLFEYIRLFLYSFVQESYGILLVISIKFFTIYKIINYNNNNKNLTKNNK